MNDIEEEKIDTGVSREPANPDEGVKESVAMWQAKITAAKTHFKDDFKRMREDMEMVRQGASKEWVDSGNYTVPIINRYLNQTVASLYAKNPKVTAERRKTLDYQIWDGKPDTAMAAMQNASMGDVSAIALLQDIESGRQNRDMIVKVGKTLEILYDYYANQQKPRLKPLIKSMVRRTKTTAVGYLMLGFQRQYGELSPDETAKLEDSRNILGELQRRMQDAEDGEMYGEYERQMFEIQTLVDQFEQRQNIILREGPLFMFPRSTEIIPDPNCKDLKGFIGAGWIAREFHKTPKEIQKIYNVDIKSGFTPYRDNGNKELAEYHASYESDSDDQGKTDKNGMVCLWEVYNKDLGQTFTIADGYNDFLIHPKEPDYHVEGFWPVFALTFNEVEHEEKLFPLSDVHNLKHVQLEYNRSREYRRLHREANKPKYVTVKGRLSDNDKNSLGDIPPHGVIELEGMGSNEKVENLIQRFQSAPIDPALYETNSEMEDVLRIVGAQEASLGGMSGGTATESSIAEGSRMTSISSNVDDLDEFLSDVMSATGQMMMMELSPETVAEIAGKGAVWPEMNREEISKQLHLTIKAGSSGRPNKASDLANMERGMPYLLQLPGVNPYPLADRYADLLDIDLDEIIVEGMPSIQALNAQAGGAQTPTSDVPSEQGGQGGDNAPKPAQNEPGAQPSFQQPIDNQQ